MSQLTGLDTAGRSLVTGPASAGALLYKAPTPLTLFQNFLPWVLYKDLMGHLLILPLSGLLPGHLKASTQA